MRVYRILLALHCRQQGGIKKTDNTVSNEKSHRMIKIRVVRPLVWTWFRPTDERTNNRKTSKERGTIVE
jgi:hypothetical protein